MVVAIASDQEIVAMKTGDEPVTVVFGDQCVVIFAAICDRLDFYVAFKIWGFVVVELQLQKKQKLKKMTIWKLYKYSLNKIDQIYRGLGFLYLLV